ncbi:MAG: hypothetical protein MRJ65_04280 [Candidatus Brocadiaceae bacterium]|nr:hypothetical protein [Candidatus Brocadiaceae bacterium]
MLFCKYSLVRDVCEGIHAMKKSPLFFLAIMFLVIDTAQGSFISMETTMSSSFQDDKVTVKVKVKNNGDESACNVQVSIEVEGKVVVTPIRKNLRINTTHSVEADFAMDTKDAGRYPCVVTVDYTDQEEYPFSAISCSCFDYKETVSPKIYGEMDGIDLSDRNKLVLIVKNFHETEKEVQIKVLVPRELSVPEPSRNILLEAKSEEETDFMIKNFSAFPGSTYYVFVVMEYNDNNRHAAVAIPCAVNIVEETDFFKEYRWVLIVIGAMLFLVFMVLQFGVRRTVDKK